MQISPALLSHIKLVLLAALAMSYGWGFRGDYGHEAGAMFPGAFLALAILLAAGRDDWQRRITIVALAGAIGWAFGGAVSYGKVIGYTAASSLPDVAYGYGSLFLIGAMWGSVGAGFLGLAVTMKRSWLNSWAGPFCLLLITWFTLDQTGYTTWLEQNYIRMDVDWVAAASALVVGLLCMLVPLWRSAASLITALSAGWCIGFFLLTVMFDLRMTPPRGDNWAGSLGMTIAFALWLYVHRNFAALYLFLVGFLAGGYGFAIADGINMMGRAHWGFFGQLVKDYHLDSWKWMEQSFGLIMGLGVALGILRLLRGRLHPPAEDAPPGLIQLIGLLFLLIVMPWLNFFKNVRNLSRDILLGNPLFDWPQEIWYLFIACGLAIMLTIACMQYYRKQLALSPSRPHGRAQLLLLYLLWLSVLAAFLQAYTHMKNTGTLWVHISFWVTAILVSIMTILQPKPSPVIETVNTHAYDDRYWKPGWCFWLLVVLIPVTIGALANVTLAMHSWPLTGSHLRFEK